MGEKLLKFSIGYYGSGRSHPIDEFIESKNNKGQAKIDFCLNLLKIHGHNLKRPYASYLRDKIWELRPGINTEEYRFFYFWHQTKAIFVHVVDKKDFKQSDIDFVIKRMKEIQAGLK